MLAGADWSALGYAERRMFVNRLRSLRSQPARLVPWLVFLLWVLLLFPQRLMLANRAVHRRELLPAEVLPYVRALLPGLALAALGWVFWRACGKAPLTFASPADGRFLCGSKLSPRTVVLWLQLRRLRLILLSSVFYVVFFSWALAASGVTALHSLQLAVALGASLLLLFSFQLPVYFAAQRWSRTAMQALALVLLGAGLAGLAAGAAYLLLPGGHRAFGLRWELGLPPGSWMLGALGGDGLDALLLVLLAALGVAVGSILAGDCYPELWQASSGAFALRQRLRQRGALGLWTARDSASATAHRAQAASSGRAPAGALVIAWKEWLVWRRQRGGIFLQLTLISIGAGVGVALAVVSQRGSRGAALTGLVIMASLFYVVTLAQLTRLGSDLRNPVWWLSADPLPLRLLVWSGAATLRVFPPLAAAIVVGGLASGRWTLVPLGLAVALSLLLLVRAVGLATYTLFPNPADMLGPGRLVRALSFYALLLPPLCAGVVTAFVTRVVMAGLVVAMAPMVGESVLLVLFAAWRIQNNGLAFARAEAQ